MTATAQLVGLAGLLFAAIGTACTRAALPGVLRISARWSPAAQHRALRGVGLAPLLWTGAALGSVLAPALLAPMWPSLDHCYAHDGHPHLCVVHGAGAPAGILGTIVLLSVLAWLAPRANAELRRLMIGHALVADLLANSRLDPQRGLWIVPTDEPVCVSVGLLRPRVVVSRGLLARTDATELAVMVAHEAAHVARRDTLWRLLVRVGSVGLGQHGRAQLDAALELSAERACDEHAAATVGDRLRVAEALLAMERLLARPATAYATAFGDGCVPARVEAMLEAPAPPCRTPHLTIVGALGLAVLVATHDELHHLTESALAYLVF